MKPLKIYVAGPYSPKSNNKHTCIQEVQRNVDNAIEAGIKIIEKGHYPFIPHLSHFIHIHPTCKKDYGVWYYEFDNTFLDDWAEALLYINSSFGADAELKRAKNLGLQIFMSLDEIPEVTK